MGTRHGADHQQIFTLCFFRQDCPIVDRVRATRIHLNVTLVANESILVDVPLDVVRVHVVRAHANRPFGRQRSPEMVLGDHQISDHSAGLANVYLMRPVAVVGEFVLGQPPGSIPLADILGHPRVVGQKVAVALLIAAVLGDDFLAAFVAGVRVVVVHADVVSGERPVVVRVGLQVRQHVELALDVPRAGEQIPQQQFVLIWVIAFRPRKWHAVLQHPSEAHPEVVGLYTMVPSSLHAGAARVDSGQEATGRIARHLVAADIVGELMRAGTFDLNPVERLAIDAIGLTADGVADSCCRHQISFVGGVNEHLSGIFSTGEHLDCSDAARLAYHADAGTVEPFIAVDGDCMVANEIFKDLFGNVRFKDPHCPAVAVHRRRALATVAVGCPFLPLPG